MSGLLAEASDGLVERSRRRSLAVVSEFSVVEVALVDDEVGVGEVEEEIRCLSDELPEGVSTAPEGMLWRDEDAGEGDERR